MNPLTFAKFLELPVYVINLKRCEARRLSAIERISKAGFNNVTIWDAVDAKIPGALERSWVVHGSPILNSVDTVFSTNKGLSHQACFLSWVNLLKHIIDNKISLFIGLEDDVLFHCSWEKLASRYLSETPQDFDVVYLGGQYQLGHTDNDKNLCQCPSYCTNALMITLHGARKMYSMLLNCPLGPRTIDCMLLDVQKHMLDTKSTHLLAWYVWNATMYPDEKRTALHTAMSVLGQPSQRLLR